MHSRRSHLTFVFGILAMGATLVLAGPGGARATDLIDPATQPHLKSWSNVIPNTNKRFIELADFNNDAVLDRETGLVWEKKPSTSQMNWIDAIRSCWQQQVGDRKGWHLPTIEELASLVDPTVPAQEPALPPGHPFQNI